MGTPITTCRCTLLLALLANGAAAQLPPTPLQQAQELTQRGDHSGAVLLLEQALADPNTPIGNRAALHRLRGEAAAAAGDPAAAREAFTRWLVLDRAADPGAAMEPNTRALFDQAKADYAARSAVVLTHVTPPPGRRGENIAVEFHLHDVFGRVSAVEAVVRAVLCGRPTADTRVTLHKGERQDTQQVFWGELPDPALGTQGNIPPGYVVEYEVVPTNEAGEVVAVNGGLSSFRLTVGSPDAGGCAAVATPTAEKEPSGGFSGPLRWTLVLMAGAVLGVGAVALLTGGLAGGAGTGLFVFCNLNRAACNLPRPSPNGRVEVQVETRGAPQ